MAGRRAIRLTAVGSLVWVKEYICQYGSSAFSDIKIDRLNNIYAVGWSDTSHLVIRYNTNGDSVWVRQIQVYDILGRIKELPVNKFINPSEYELTIDGINYSSGVYFYRLIADGSIIDTKKFIVLK